jgi:hypothetical protein
MNSLPHEALKEIIAGQQHESKIFTTDENKSLLLLGTLIMVKRLILGGGDETCKATGSNASYIIKGKYK